MIIEMDNGERGVVWLTCTPEEPGEAELLARAVVSTFVGVDGLASGHLELGTRYRAAITRSGAWRDVKLQPLWFRS